MVVVTGGEQVVAEDLLADPARSPLPLRLRVQAAVTGVVLLAGLASVDRVREVERRDRLRAESQRIDLVWGSAAAVAGGGSDLFVSVELENAGADVVLSDGTFEGAGLRLLAPLAGALPVAGGTTAELTAQLAPTCTDAPVSGTFTVVIEAGGRTETVRYELDPAVVAGVARDVCANAQLQVEVVDVLPSEDRVAALLRVQPAARRPYTVDGAVLPGFLVELEQAGPFDEAHDVAVELRVDDCGAARQQTHPVPLLLVTEEDEEQASAQPAFGRSDELVRALLGLVGRRC